MKYHYTYRITNIKDRMYYYGVHSCDCSPKEDIGVKYFSSSNKKEFIKEQKENPQDYKYKVLKIFSTRKEAVEHEIFLHKKFNVKIHEQFYNNANQTSTGFDASGKGVYVNEFGNNELFSLEEAKRRCLNGVCKNIPKSEETKRRMSESSKGKKKSQEHILARIKAVTAKQENGKNIMQEAAQKAMKTKINRPDSHENSMVNIGKKISLKLNEIGSSGETISKERSLKQKESVRINSEADGEYYNKINEKRRNTGNTLLENGKTIFQQSSIKAANTMKTTIQENGKTIEENRHIKANNTKYELTDKFNVYHINNGLIYSNLTAMEVYRISPSLRSKTKENWLGKNSNSLRARLINRNESYKLDLYVEKVV